MNTIDLKAHIKNKSLDKFYIFTGPEIKVRNIYIEQLAKSGNLTLRHIDTLQDLCRNARTRSLLSESFLSVIIDDTSILSDTKLQDVLERSSTFKNDVIVLVFNNIDKRTTFYKKYKDRIVEFECLPEETIIKYIQKDIDLSKANCKILIEVCESNYNRILLEIDKIKAYDEKPDAIFRQLLETGVIHVPARDAIFDFIDAVFLKKKELSYELLQECYDSGEATLVILSNLFMNAQYVLQVQSYDGDNIVQSSGLTPFQVKLGKMRAGLYKNAELMNLMRSVQEVESGIKSGKIEEQVAVKYVLARLWL